MNKDAPFRKQMTKVRLPRLTEDYLSTFAIKAKSLILQPSRVNRHNAAKFLIPFIEILSLSP
jgi:hypothetical protein